MKVIEYVYYKILKDFETSGKERFTQLDLAKKLKISLSTVNLALKPLRKMYAVEIKPGCFYIRNLKKILLHWANIRNPVKDVIFKARVDAPVTKAEKTMPHDIIFTAYSGFRYLFGYSPSDYSEIYAYGTGESVKEIKKRFDFSKGPDNLFILDKGKIKEITKSLIFVDTWNLSEWYARDFLKALEKEMIKIGILE